VYRPHAPQQHPEVKMPKGSARFRAQASKGAAFLGGSAGGDCARNPLAQVDARRAVQALPQSGLHAAVRGGIARNPRTIRALGDPGRKVVAVRLADVGRSAGEARRNWTASPFSFEVMVCRPRLSPGMAIHLLNTSFFRLVRFRPRALRRATPGDFSVGVAQKCTE